MVGKQSSRTMFPGIIWMFPGAVRPFRGGMPRSLGGMPRCLGGTGPCLGTAAPDRGAVGPFRGGTARGAGGSGPFPGGTRALLPARRKVKRKDGRVFQLAVLIHHCAGWIMSSTKHGNQKKAARRLATSVCIESAAGNCFAHRTPAISTA